MITRTLHILFFSFALLCCGCPDTFAQNSGIYHFNNSFSSDDDKLPALTVLGQKGSFKVEKLSEIDRKEKMVYAFGKNDGLKFDNSLAGNFLGRSYSIEIYFKFTDLASWRRVVDWKNRTMDQGAYIFDGKLNFYKLVVSGDAPVRANEYTHYIITRDDQSGMVKIYADGKSEVEFEDFADLAVLGPDNELHFFYDDLVVKNEASAGSVAYIKLYDHVIPSEDAAEAFNKLEETVFEQAENVTTSISLESVTNKTTFLFKDAQSKADVPALVKIDGAGEIQTQGSYELEADFSSVELAIKAPGYFSIDTLITSSGTTTHTIFLSPATTGSVLQLKNINFKQSKAEILPDSKASLESLLLFMRDNANISIELSGHTDNTGSPRLNTELSEQRALKVKEYLVQNGISKKRISHKGYGGYRPLVPNRDEASKKKNRRVECKITKS